MKHKMITLPVVIRMITQPIVIIGCFLLVARPLIDPHLLIHSWPYIGGTYHPQSKCSELAISLAIALGASEHIYKGWEFGLEQATSSISSGNCIEVKDGQTNPLAKLDVRSQYESASQNFNINEPSGWVFRKSLPSSPPSLYHRWPIGVLSSLIKNYKTISSGKGIIHYLRCDYSLYLEPHHTFILADLYLKETRAEVVERLNECNELENFNSLVQNRLNDIRP